MLAKCANQTKFTKTKVYQTYALWCWPLVIRWTVRSRYARFTWMLILRGCLVFGTLFGNYLSTCWCIQQNCAPGLPAHSSLQLRLSQPAWPRESRFLHTFVCLVLVLFMLRQGHFVLGRWYLKLESFQMCSDDKVQAYCTSNCVELLISRLSVYLSALTLMPLLVCVIFACEGLSTREFPVADE